MTVVNEDNPNIINDMRKEMKNTLKIQINISICKKTF